MPDRHIDYREASEYGMYFVRRLRTLRTAAGSLVDVVTVEQMVLGAVRDVEAELGTSNTTRSELRGDRLDTEQQSEAVCVIIRRFFHHLHSLPDNIVFDLNAFFPSGSFGDLTKLKPADLLAHCDQVLRGFDAPKNQSLPNASSWRADVLAARDALDSAIGSKGSSNSGKRRASRSLIQARKRFLHVYNHVAKPLTRGLLNHLGRGDEFRSFFLDLQVNEGSNAGRSEALPEPSGEDQPADEPAGA